MKRFFALAAMAVSALSTAGSADAACYVGSATPVRVNLNSTGIAYIYFHPHALYNYPTAGANTVLTVNPSLSSVWWQATVSTSTSAGAAIVNAAVAAVEHQTKVLIYSDGTCGPTTGSGISIGNVTTLVVNP